MQLFQFQQKAIECLIENFKQFWGNRDRGKKIIFQSPTGSGKTLMMSSFIIETNRQTDWNQDKAFIWITFSDNLAMQSKQKFDKYFPNNGFRLLTINDFHEKKLNPNAIFFINWEKLVSKKKENRLLRRPDDKNKIKEQEYYFEDIIENTHKEKREIVLIIDESHRHSGTELAKKVIDIINPKLTIHVSATPKENISHVDVLSGEIGYVTVNREDVVDEGLIKERILLQTEEEINQYESEIKDLDELLLDLAIDRRESIKAEYVKLYKSINPLVLIQLPNENQETNEITLSKKDFVLHYLKTKKQIKKDRIAQWFDNQKKNLNGIEENENSVDFLLFKQAIGTGWDCPRAHILVMYRDVKEAVPYVQTVGRILRMAEPNRIDDYKNNPNLKLGYLYTNYQRNDLENLSDFIGKENKPYIYESAPINNLEQIEGLYSEYVSRTDYGDLGASKSFQDSFIKTFNQFFEIKKEDPIDTRKVKLQRKGVDTNPPRITNELVTGWEIVDYNKIDIELHKLGNEIHWELSTNDIEKLMNFSFQNLLKEQTNPKTKISNIARSWTTVKSAFRLWFDSVFKQNVNLLYYNILLNDFNLENSIFKKAFTHALLNYYPIKERFIEKRETKAKQKIQFKIGDVYRFTEDFEPLNGINLCAIQPFYIKKEYLGRKNELKFIRFLEGQGELLDWWFKNGDYGKEYYSLRYTNTKKNEHSMFYPDWILRFKDGKVGLFDTKGGKTAENTEGRVQGLASKLDELNSEKNIYIGGIVVQEQGNWFYFDTNRFVNFNEEKDYNYNQGNLSDDWRLLIDLFKKNLN